MTTEKRTENLTQKLIESDLPPNQTEPGSDTSYTVWDACPGFGLIVYPVGPENSATDGRKVFFVECTVGGKAQKITIGESTAITVEQAREMAQMIVAWAGLGEDVDKLRETAKQVIAALVECPYKNKIRFREMAVESFIKVKMLEVGSDD
jgi:hypothetical protein